MAFRWRADDCLTVNAGLVAFDFFQGGGVRTPAPLWIRAWAYIKMLSCKLEPKEQKTHILANDVIITYVTTYDTNL